MESERGGASASAPLLFLTDGASYITVRPWYPNWLRHIWTVVRLKRQKRSFSWREIRTYFHQLWRLLQLHALKQGMRACSQGQTWDLSKKSILPNDSSASECDTAVLPYPKVDKITQIHSENGVHCPIFWSSYLISHDQFCNDGGALSSENGPHSKCANNKETKRRRQKNGNTE